MEAIPASTRELVESRARAGCVDGSHLVLFYVLKMFNPGGATEQVTLLKSMGNRKICANARAAQLELIKWKDNMRRLMELEIPSPLFIIPYRAVESIFIAVSDKADAQLHAKWFTVKSQVGLPHHIDSTTLNRVAALVEAELGALALEGQNSLNTGLPLRDDQKARSTQI